LEAIGEQTDAPRTTYRDEDGSAEDASEKSEWGISSRVIRDRQDVQEKVQDESRCRKSSENLDEKVPKGPFN
jgi:hypothetical protein